MGLLGAGRLPRALPVSLKSAGEEARGTAGSLVVASVLELRGISKRFGSVEALSAVDLTLKPGQVHALAGENGAGKSTLVKVIAGIHKLDAGQILMDGRPIVLNGATGAQAA